MSFLRSVSDGICCVIRIQGVQCKLEKIGKYGMDNRDVADMLARC